MPCRVNNVIVLRKNKILINGTIREEDGIWKEEYVGAEAGAVGVNKQRTWS